MTVTPEHKEALAEGRRRAAAVRRLRAQTQPADEPRVVQVVYKPVNAGDPHTTTWNGVEFQANVAVELSRANMAHYVEVLEPQWFVNPLSGRRQSEHVEQMRFMGDIAKGNPSFMVDGKQFERKPVRARSVPPPGSDWVEGHSTEAMNVPAAAWDGVS